MEIAKQILTQFKEKLGKGQSVIGPFMKTADPSFVEVAGYSGFDFCILDLEHGPGTVQNMQNLITAALVSGIFPIIRTPGVSEEIISKTLDIGVLGIQVPQINNAEQAKNVIKFAKFHPQGERGVCRFVRAAKFSTMDRYEYFKNANEALIILQIEGQEGVKNLDEILEVNGFDILFIGPYDLSQSLGVPGQITNPKVLEKMEYIVKKARSKNIVVGTFLDQIEAIERWKKVGIQYLSYSVDVGIFADACKAIVKNHNP